MKTPSAVAGTPENTLFKGFIWVAIKRLFYAGKRAMEPACWLLNTLDQSHFLELDERQGLGAGEGVVQRTRWLQNTHLQSPLQGTDRASIGGIILFAGRPGIEHGSLVRKSVILPLAHRG